MLRRRVIADPGGTGEADVCLRNGRDQPQDAGTSAEHDFNLRPDHRQRLAVPVVGEDRAAVVDDGEGHGWPQALFILTGLKANRWI